MDNQTLYNLIVDAPFYPLNEKKYSSSVRDLVSGLLEKNPGLRIGSFREKDILEHEWFSSINIDLMRGKKLEAFWVPDPIELEDGYDSLVG